MEKYDEDLLDNEFLIALKSKHRTIFIEAVTNEQIVCVPKSGVVCELTLDVALDHILIPSLSDENSSKFVHSYITKRGTGLVLGNGKICLKENPHKYLNILFEETFYEQNLKGYKIVCLDDSISNLSIETKPNSSIYTDQNLYDCQIWRNLRTLNDFKYNIIQASCNPLAINEIDCSIKEFLLKNDLSQQEFEVVRSKVHDLITTCAKNFFHENMQLSNAKMNVLSICIESYIIHYVHSEVFPIITSYMAANDEKLNRIIHSVKDLSLSDINVKIHNINSGLSAKYELAAINNFKSPFGKLQCIKRTIQCFETINTLTSDDLLPILIFCLIKCNLTNWFANLHFIQSFMFSLKTNNEYSYILSSFEAAIAFIHSGGINRTEFQNLNRDCGGNEAKFDLENFNPKLLKHENEIQFYLYESIRRKNIERVKSIFENKTQTQTYPTIPEEGPSLCHPLCSCENCKLVLQDYLKPTAFKISPNLKDENLSNSLHIAAWYASIDIVEYLISVGVNYNAKNIAGMTPLHFAAYKGHQSVVLLLLHSGCDINSTDVEGNTALHLACKAGQDSCVKALIFYAESVGNMKCFNMKNRFGDTPLHLASHWGYLSIVKFLLDQYKITTDSLVAKNLRNQTPRDCAQNGFVLSILMEAEEKDSNDEMNLILLNFEKSKGQEVLKKTSENNVPVSQNKDLLETVLDVVKDGDLRLLCNYLEIDDDISFRQTNSPSGMNKCHPLCQCSDCLSKLPLVASKFSHLMNAIGKEGVGVLHTAISINNVEICHILLRNGADSNLKTKEQKTCLHLSVLGKNLEIMKSLILFNADVNCPDKFGNTPLQLCFMQRWREGAALLIENGAKIK